MSWTTLGEIPVSFNLSQPHLGQTAKFGEMLRLLVALTTPYAA